MLLSLLGDAQFPDGCAFPGDRGWVGSSWAMLQRHSRLRNKRQGWVAQLVEQRTENPCVGGSIPPPATTLGFLNEIKGQPSETRWETLESRSIWAASGPLFGC